MNFQILLSIAQKLIMMMRIYRKQKFILIGETFARETFANSQFFAIFTFAELLNRETLSHKIKQVKKSNDYARNFEVFLTKKSLITKVYLVKFCEFVLSQKFIQKIWRISDIVKVSLIKVTLKVKEGRVTVRIQLCESSV